MITTFKEAEEYILDIPRFGGKNTLEDTKEFLKECGDISKDFPTIHIAGTNGKGSVCALLRDTFIEAGYTPAVFTSPHLVSIRERFTIGREEITEEEFLDCFNKVLAVMHREKFALKGYHPSYFEFLFFMAVIWFKEKSPDVVILETGLGGRLDATNSIESPVLTIITEIGFDHTEYLGDTIEKIAFEKAGILKKNVPLVYMSKETSSDVIEKRAKELGVETFPVSKDYIKNLKVSTKGIDFSFESPYYENVNLSLKARALYQSENGAVAFCALNLLRTFDIFKISDDEIRRGFLSMYWPGRMEEISKNIFLDGAHNEDGIKAFLESVAEDNAKARRLLFTAVSDKNVEKITKMIADSSLFSHVYIAPLKSSRAASIERLLSDFEKCNVSVVSYESTVLAFKAMCAEMKPDETGYVAGSLYLVGEIKDSLL
ncbi:MAG: bifunctional folylpolyglutamate synthase/dihydrofolate synthase [Lachnospiraceae bacterium]|nr:bifunctional folylpolyglutamate synthase/dihydrofolate synthase [Lachnospiraceae bacterium]